jgi:1-pyrroline-5-carboxylate dehydrogenase
MDAVTQVPAPANEPVLDYAPGSRERAALEVALAELGSNPMDLPHTIDGKRVMGSGKKIDVRQPHAKRKVLGTMRNATVADAQAAVDAAKAAAPAWRELSFDDRAAVLLKAAELLSGPWRAQLNAATMLGQSKTAYQAEIDSACELIDFWRINVHFARQILAEQPPLNAKGIWNRTDYRPLEGFVYAITPFNFTLPPPWLKGSVKTVGSFMSFQVPAAPSSTSDWCSSPHHWRTSGRVKSAKTASSGHT